MGGVELLVLWKPFSGEGGKPHIGATRDKSSESRLSVAGLVPSGGLGKFLDTGPMAAA